MYDDVLLVIFLLLGDGLIPNRVSPSPGILGLGLGLELDNILGREVQQSPGYTGEF